MYAGWGDVGIGDQCMGTIDGAMVKVKEAGRLAVADFNALASVGGLLFGLTQVYFLFFIVIPNLRGGVKASAHAWEGAEGLEWTVPSPAPFRTFEKPPVVK